MNFGVPFLEEDGDWLRVRRDLPTLCPRRAGSMLGQNFQNRWLCHMAGSGPMAEQPTTSPRLSRNT
jgi:hypothetical protein